MKIFKISFSVGILIFAILSCHNQNTFKATETCNNLRFHAHTIFPGEIIKIRFNEKILLIDTISSFQDGYYYDKFFCIPKTKNCTIEINTYLQTKNYIDTSFLINTEYVNHILISMPHPYNWRDYYKDSIPPNNWGHLSIDSCIRFVSIIPDSLYTNTLEI